jgi:hypothetical protein
VAITAAVVGGGLLLFPSLTLLFRVTLGGRLGHTESSGRSSTISRSAMLSRSAPGTHARVVGARLLIGAAFLSIADAGWAHAIGILALLAFIVPASDVLAPGRWPLDRQLSLAPRRPAARDLGRSMPGGELRAVGVLTEIDGLRPPREQDVTGQRDTLGARRPSVAATLELGAQVEQLGLPGLNRAPGVRWLYRADRSDRPHLRRIPARSLNIKCVQHMT